MTFETFALNKTSGIKVHIVDHAHGNEVGLLRMEFDAADTFAFAILVIHEVARLHRSRASLASVFGFLST